MAHEQTAEKAARATLDLHKCHAIQQTELELHQLIKERAKVTKRIRRLKQTINGLADLFGDGILDASLLDLFDRKSNSSGLGITPACRTTLMAAARPMSARDICDEIQRTAPALLAHHKDPMATIYTILGRLVYYGEATALSGDRGERTWLWAAERNNGLIEPDTGGSRPAAQHRGASHDPSEKLTRTPRTASWANSEIR
jgi:hypothetical protein